ncbi:hypothetical protein M426DRAFT_323655 [Hypoxylon sp. CI-4A]|nr:hypothetical protein M426DRAFT_323655 [Hypoxylon sp. CI-4A]
MNVTNSWWQEGLRLYPPTKRIHRAVPTEYTNAYAVVAADVEWCHRNGCIWGPDALKFRPSRFRTEREPGEYDAPLTDDMRHAFMPFGVGKHQCPTASKFSYRAIIILVVALAEKLGTRESGAKMRFDDAVLDGNLEALLPSGRMDMEGWKLEMRDESA